MVEGGVLVDDAEASFPAEGGKGAKILCLACPRFWAMGWLGSFFHLQEGSSATFCSCEGVNKNGDGTRPSDVFQTPWL